MRTSKKFRIVLILAIATALVIPAFGATNGSLSISGNVPTIFQLTVNSDLSMSALPVTISITNSTLATFYERSNNRAGYTLSLQSANVGLLMGETGNTDTLPYTLTYNGVAVALNATGQAILTDASTKTVSNPTGKVLAISFDGASVFLNADNYTDVLTYTMMAK